MLYKACGPLVLSCSYDDHDVYITLGTTDINFKMFVCVGVGGDIGGDYWLNQMC